MDEPSEKLFWEKLAAGDLVLASAPIPAVLLDRNIHVRAWNAAAERAFGWSAGELLGTPYPMMPPGGEADLERLGSRILAGETLRGLRGRRSRKDGSEVTIEISASPLRDEEGSIRGIIGLLLDVTEAERAYAATVQAVTEKREIKEQMTGLSWAVDQSPASIIITDSEGTIEYVNAGFTRITGYSRQEALGQNTRMLKSGETAPEIYKKLWQTILAGDDWHGELRNKRKDGGLIWVRASISPIKEAGGEFSRFLGIEEDVTELKNLEHQSFQAQKIESVGRLAGGVAHDINNVLTAIVGYADLAEKGLPPGSPVRADLLEIHSAARRVAGIVRQLLAFSRQELFLPAPLDLNELVVNLSRMLRSLIGEDIALTTALGPGLWAVKADPGLIEQVLVNLAVNARDAMAGGGKLLIESANVTLDAEFERRHPGLGVGDFVMLAVNDSGTGMPPEVVAHLFEPYFTTKEKGKGTGLGLATCFGIAKQHGGFLYPETALGRGTTFKLYLPRSSVSVGPAAAAGPGRALPRGSETILLVEDEASVRAVIFRLLGGLGYTVLESCDGQEALVSAQDFAGKIDLVLTDVVLPKMGGRELAVRLALARPETKILLMSGYTADRVVRQGVAKKGIHFLQKPLSAESLALKVRETLDAP